MFLILFDKLQRFSPCSLRSIRKVLQAKSGRCFSEPEESFCGNLRVEGDEECDAGLLGHYIIFFNNQYILVHY